MWTPKRQKNHRKIPGKMVNSLRKMVIEQKKTCDLGDKFDVFVLYVCDACDLCFGLTRGLIIGF